jgi:putative transposase
VVATPDGTDVGRVGALKPLTRAQSRLRAAQRQAARRRGPYDPQTKTHREPANRWQRANARVGRIHAKVAAIRADEIHKATTALAIGHGGRIRTQLDYKSTWYGTTLMIAPRCFPRHSCVRGVAKIKLRLRDRVYQCRNGCPPID